MLAAKNRILVPILTIGILFTAGYQNCGRHSFLGQSEKENSSASEPELSPNEPPLRNLSQRKTVTSLLPFNIGYGQPPSNLVDSDNNTAVYPGTFSYDFRIDLGDTFTVRGGRIFFGAFATTSYIESWSLVAEGPAGEETVIASGAVPVIEEFVDSNVRARAVRLRATSSLNWIGAYGVEIFGY